MSYETLDMITITTKCFFSRNATAICGAILPTAKVVTLPNISPYVYQKPNSIDPPPYKKSKKKTKRFREAFGKSG